MSKKFEYRLSRRDFMKLAAVATASAAIPTFMLMTPALQDSLVKAQAPVSNGLRGQNLNMGWKFNRGDVTNGQSTSFNDSAWRSLNVPHDWSIELAFNQSSAAGSGGGYLDGGIGWYRKTFTLDSSYSGQRIFIQFDGAYMNSQVWINGTSLGTRPYGYSSFEYEITPYVNFGATTNVIAVRLNNNQPTTRWYSGSGIYRNVWLTVLNQTHVDYCGMFVTTPSVSSSSATVNVSAKVVNQSGASQSVTLTTTIINASGSTVTSNTSSAVNIGAGGNSTFSQNLTVSNPQLWSPSSPYLYTAQTQVVIGGTVVDTYKSTLGIRYFAFDANNGFSLNGVSMKLKGVCMHHDLGSLGAAVNYRAIERQLQIMKNMGANAIRTSHNPADPQLLDICDRLGLMVMEEAFDCWETAKNTNDYHLYFSSWAQTDIQAMVTRDRNHPSIIMWSIGNEIPSATLATATNLRNWVRQIDTTRPVTGGSNDTYNAFPTEVYNILDLVGYNYNPGLYDARHSSHPTWKIFGSETCSAYRSRGIYKTPPSQNIPTGSDNQASSYDNSVPGYGNSAESSYGYVNSRNFVAGEFVWTGFDYIGEPVPYAWPAKSSYFGIVDTAGFPKDVYYFYQSKWSTTPMVHVLPHWNWSSGTTVEVWAYSNCDTVELFLNGVSQGVKTVGSNLHLAWNVPWASGTIQAKATKGSTVVFDQVTTAGAANKVALSVDRSTINGDGEDLAFITADIRDASNNFVPTASNTVNFSVSGPGKLVGVDNGNSISLESYKGTSRQAFSGKCLAIIQSTGGAGTITLTASSSGLTGASVNITAQGGTTPTNTPVVPTFTPVSGRYEAESAALSGGAMVATDHTGYSGTGFVAGYVSGTGQKTSFTVNVAAAGGYNVTLRYANSIGSAQTESLYVNGVKVATPSYPNLANWDTWADSTTALTLNAGNNTIVYQKDTGNGCINLDYITVQSGTGPTSTPTRTPTPGGPTATPTRTPTPTSGFPVPGTYYRLINRNSGKCLDVFGNSTADGANVDQWTSNGGQNQQWSFVAQAGGYYEIIARNSGKALEVAGSSTADGANVDQFTWTGGNNQQWTLTAVTGGYYKLINRNSGKALDVVGNGTADGVNVDQWTDNGGNNQQWQIVP